MLGTPIPTCWRTLIVMSESSARTNENPDEASSLGERSQRLSDDRPECSARLSHAAALPTGRAGREQVARTYRRSVGVREAPDFTHQCDADALVPAIQDDRWLHSA